MKNNISAWSRMKMTLATLTGNFSFLTLNEARKCFKDAVMAPEMSRLEPWTKKWQKCGLRWIATAATDSEEIFGFLQTMKSFLDQKFQPLGDVDSIGVALSEAGGCEMIKHLTHPQFDKTYKRLKAFSGNIM